MTTLREATEADLDALVAMNNEAVPAVAAADRERMAELVELAALSWVVDADDAAGRSRGPLAGFVLLFEPGSTYDSRNYAWFSERYDRFLYVDRIVVAPSYRGAGLGAQIYDAVAAEAVRRGSERVTAEVNLEPPNPGSSRFHRGHGFEPAGVQHLGDGYAVEMLVRPGRLNRREG